LTFSEGLTNFIKSECGPRRFKGSIKTSGSKKIKNALDKYAHIMHNDTYIYTFKELIMRTTLNIDDKLIGKASKLTGVKEKTSLVRLGLEALIALESSKRLAILGGTEKKLKPIPRRRSGGR